MVSTIFCLHLKQAQWRRYIIPFSFFNLQHRQKSYDSLKTLKVNNNMISYCLLIYALLFQTFFSKQIQSTFVIRLFLVIVNLRTLVTSHKQKGQGVWLASSGANRKRCWSAQQHSQFVYFNHTIISKQYLLLLINLFSLNTYLIPTLIHIFRYN